MIHYDDGDKEHMPEDDISKTLIAEKCKKRKANSQSNNMNVSDKDPVAVPLEKKGMKSVSGKAKADVSENQGSVVSAENPSRHTNLRIHFERNETPSEGRRDGKLSQSVIQKRPTRSRYPKPHH